MINTTNNEFFHLHVMEQNFQSKVPYNQPHTADLQLINYYQLQNAQVIVISFTEEAL